MMHYVKRMICLLSLLLIISISPIQAANKVSLNTTKKSLIITKSYQLVLKNSKNPKWASSNKKVATVKNGLVKAVGFGTTKITAKYKKKTYTCKITVPKVSLSSTSIKIGKDKTYTIKAKNAPSVTWSVKDKTIASISQKGVIKGINYGKTIITGKVNNVSYTANLEVLPITLNKSKTTLYYGESESLKSLYVDSATYTSSNKKIVKVTKKGKITALQFGTATITATSNGKTSKCKVTVPKITLSKSDLSLKVGEKFTVKVNNASTITYTSDKSTIAKVNTKGKITAKRKGNTIIHAKVHDLDYPINVKVLTPVLSKTSLTLQAGKSSTLTLTNATNVTWTSSNTKVATVTNGKITAIKAGTATITASFGTIKIASCALTVTASTTSTTVTSTAYDVTAKVGTTVNVRTKFTGSSMSFTTSNEKVALISTGDIPGILMPISAGTCTITCKSSTGTKSIKVKVTDPGNVKVGVDISRHNGSVNFKTLLSNNIDFAIIRAGNGQLVGTTSSTATCDKNGKDKSFATYIANCKAAGMPYGVYWYLASSNSKEMTTADAKLQAEKLVAILGTDKANRRIYLDLEDTTLIKGETTNKARTANVAKVTKQFVDTLVSKGVPRKNITLYANKSWFENYMLDSYFLTFTDLWEARYGIASSQPGFTINGVKVLPKIWQCGSTYKISGVGSTYVDMNYLYE